MLSRERESGVGFCGVGSGVRGGGGSILKLLVSILYAYSFASSLILIFINPISQILSDFLNFWLILVRGARERI